MHPTALSEKADELAKAAIDSALLGSGQFCTKPGILVIPDDASGDKFISQVESYVATQKVAPLLNKGIASRFTDAVSSFTKSKGLKSIASVHVRCLVKFQSETSIAYYESPLKNCQSKA